MGKVFSEYFGFPYQSSFHRLLHTHDLSSGAGTICQLVADVPSGVSLTPPQEKKKVPSKFVYGKILKKSAQMTPIYMRSLGWNDQQARFIW
jgi:hypothetical protein